MLNSSVNPIVYAVLMPEFRRAMSVTIGELTCGLCGVRRDAGVAKNDDSDMSCTVNGGANDIVSTTMAVSVDDKV